MSTTDLTVAQAAGLAPYYRAGEPRGPQMDRRYRLTDHGRAASKPKTTSSEGRSEPRRSPTPTGVVPGHPHCTSNLRRLCRGELPWGWVKEGAP